MSRAPPTALTLWPEWAWAIVHLGKRTENRGWSLPVGRWVAIHAGRHVGGRPGLPSTMDGIDGLVEMARRAGWSVDGSYRKAAYIRGAVTVEWNLDAVPTSAIVGLAKIIAADPPGMGDIGGWRVPEAVGNRFEFRPLREPVSCRGAQGLWTVPDDIADRVRSSLQPRTLPR